MSKNKIVLVLFSVLVLACNKNDDDAEQNEVSCELLVTALTNLDVEAVNFEINKLTVDLVPISTQSDALGHSENLDTLVARINVNCDGLEAFKLCYACIETLPLQSEIKVTYSAGETQYERIIDISTPEDGVLMSLDTHLE